MSNCSHSSFLPDIFWLYFPVYKKSGMLISHHFHKMSLKRNKAVYINDYCINIFQILYNHVCRFIQKMYGAQNEA